MLVSACGSVGDDPDASPQPDTTIPDACIAESDQELCARLAACESVTSTDICGVPRTVDCGGCSGGNACVENVCRAPVCGSLAFPNQTLLTAINSPGQQDAPTGMTPTGDTVLLQRRSTCGGPFTLLIADSVGVANTISNLSSAPGLQGMRIGNENHLTLTADGRTIIGVDIAGTGFLASTRSALGATDFNIAAAGELAAITVTGSRRLFGPAISTDGLAFYYTIANDPDPNVNGIYESVRASKAVPFPAGTRMPAVVQSFSFVTATSVDRMTLFLHTHTFSMVVLKRTSVTRPFVNPNAPAAAPIIPGFRTRPLGACDRLVGTCTGGCTNEDTCVFSM